MSQQTSIPSINKVKNNINQLVRIVLTDINNARSDQYVSSNQEISFSIIMSPNTFSLYKKMTDGTDFEQRSCSDPPTCSHRSILVQETHRHLEIIDSVWCADQIYFCHLINQEIFINSHTGKVLRFILTDVNVRRSDRIIGISSD
ncbi:unnamed protein product [Rotaria sp. Silwood1]|nr:unnamed protein product [Rotaria sp. Silwood1]CAF1651197.1 unnamed protein product [Rotaria sp. Silwood1]CAF3815721.1 unnamed protein product [Rotaria sp. Silwood1]CAF4794291.1 unnamed protein product [Rotaria sp. Silwood1]